MNNTVRTIIVIYIIAFMAICLFFIPCKQFIYGAGNNTVFTGSRDTYSVFELYQIVRVSNTQPDFYYIDWQVLWIELLPLTVLAIGSIIIFKE